MRGRAEALHQMRVGLRRLRAAITIFADLLVGSDAGRIKAELRWITRELGPARDLDVFAADVLRPLQAAHPADQRVSAAHRDFEERRKTAYARAAGSVGSNRFRNALLDLAEWIEVGAWASNETAAAGSITEHAANELARLSKQIKKRGADLRHRSAHQRHRLRIRAKRLRYATEFFASTFPTEANIKRRAECLAPGPARRARRTNDLETRHGLMREDASNSAIPDPAKNKPCRSPARAAEQAACASRPPSPSEGMRSRRRLLGLA